MIWAYLMHLGKLMWGDFGPGDGGKCIITDKWTFDDKVWRDVSQRLHDQGRCNMIVMDIGEGVEYESHPEIKAPGSWSKKQLSAEISRLRALGFEVIPKLNFSTGHDKWMGIYSRMISTPQYYQFCTDVIDEVCELFGNPSLFHLGMDEECFAIQKKNPLCIIRQHDLYWHDINFLIKAVEKNGSRPWLWADYIWHVPENEKDFVENMSHDALLSNWYYGDWEEDYFAEARRGYVALEEHGFEQVPTGGNCDKTREYTEENMLLTVKQCTNIVAPERLHGFMMTPWEMTSEIMRPRLLAAADRLAEAHDYYYERG